jgi:hypothetical protein
MVTKKPSKQFTTTYNNRGKLESIDDGNFVSNVFAKYAKYGGKEKYDFIPVAHSIKVFNQSTTTIPNLCYESIIIINISLPQSRDNSETTDIFILICCKHQITTTEHRFFIGETYEYASKEFLNSFSKNSISTLPKKIIIRKYNLKIFKRLPTIPQIKEFILSTDFGNNNIYPYTDFATLFNCEVITVNINKKYEKLLPVFKVGLTGKKLKERINIYNRALVGITATVSAGSN